MAERCHDVFLADATHNLITRLHHNVIRIGLRRINLAYSRISLAEIAAKLHLNNAEDAGACAWQPGRQGLGNPNRAQAVWGRGAAPATR